MMSQTIVERERVESARSLIVVGEEEGNYALETLFSDLGPELYRRCLQEKGGRSGFYLDGLKLVAALDPACERIEAVLTRLDLFELVVAEIIRSMDDESSWRAFVALCIKDFHADISSVMDAVAHLVVTMAGKSKPRKYPAFSSIRKDSDNRRLRRAIPCSVREVIDKTDRWWPMVKEVRDTLVHRPHIDLVFGYPADDIKFQIRNNEPHLQPMILDDTLLCADGTHVVDFSLYSSFVVAELLLFLEDLAGEIASRKDIEITQEGIRLNRYKGNLKMLVASWDRLLSALA